MGDVVLWPKLGELPPAAVLADAAQRELDQVFVMGFSKDGDVYFAASMADGGDLLWLMEVAKTRLMTTVQEQG